MARIYLSSTYEDLKDHREKVHHSLRQLGHEVTAMEDYVARDARPLDACLRDVGKSDLYVGVVAWRYGYVPDVDNPARRSITELEYRHAENKPRLVFMLHEDAAWLPRYQDAHTGEGENGRRIRELREELGAGRLASFFKSADELARLVSIAVSNQLAETGRAAADAAKPTVTLDAAIVGAIRARLGPPLSA